MAYPFVPSFYDYGPRNVVIRPLTINVHMAEGGGTVGYLAKANPNRVAVHYVIEYGGRIVQMLHESHVNGSINPRDIRTTDDAPYTYRGATIRYGATAAKKALGIWWEDPNRATIGNEIEGFARDGPNATQAAALVRLVADIRTRQKGAPLVGHRDFADYKACPGKRIDWGALGGHVSNEREADVPALDWYPIPRPAGTATLKAGRGLVNLVTGSATVPDDTTKTVLGGVHLATPWSAEAGMQNGYLVRHAQQAHVMLDGVTETFTPADPATGPTAPLTLTGEGVEYRRV